MKRAREGGGTEALSRRPPPGARPRLRADQRVQIPGLLISGAEAHGFRGDVWTAKRVTEVIWRHFGVRYHPDHVSRQRRHLGWSRQQPFERAAQRDEEAIQQWQEERWPALKKKAIDEGYTIVWGDESAFYLLPLGAIAGLRT